MIKGLNSNNNDAYYLGHLGLFYEVRVDEINKNFSVFALLENKRKTYR
jgi:hypothetical protein